MPNTSFEQRRLLESLDRDALRLLQLSKLNAMFERILPENEFYTRKLGGVKLPLQSLADLQQLPLTTKEELTTGVADEYSANRTYTLQRYVRFHRTSGTRGRPLIVLDTPADWQWWIDTWQFTLDAANLGPDDRVLMAFSFGPFIGFWTAHDAALSRGALVVPGGGLSSLARLDLIRSQRITALFCTPSYALHLAEVAEQNQVNVAELGVRHIVVAGEPGGSVPSIRDRIEREWKTRVIDHAGATEVGPWGYSDENGRGLRVVECEFIAEFLSLESESAAAEGELAELVLTTLGRDGSPVIRYRTGDLVRPRWLSTERNRFVLLDGGLLGRTDDMLIIRGVNIFPTAVEAILRSLPEVDEFRLTAKKAGQLDELLIEVEDRLQQPDRIADALQIRLGLRVEVCCVPAGSLPRFEGKGKRFIDLRRAE